MTNLSSRVAIAAIALLAAAGTSAVAQEEPAVVLTCTPLELSVENRESNRIEVFVRAANTEPVDYNEYRFDLDPGQGMDVDTSTFDHSGSGVVAVQVVIRELTDPSTAPLCTEVFEFRCPEVPQSETLSPSFESDVRAAIQPPGLKIGAAGSPIGNRIGCPFHEISSGFYGNFTEHPITGVVHSKYICAPTTSVSDFDDDPVACCDFPSFGAESCCYAEAGVTGDNLCPGSSGCVVSPRPIGIGEAIESAYLLATLEPDTCAGGEIKDSPRLACRNGAAPGQRKYPECCDADDEEHSNVATVTCAAMVVTHAEEDGVLKELSQPFWTSYAMDSEIGVTYDFPTQRYVSPDELMFDCMDFTVADVEPIASLRMNDGNCSDFSLNDANDNGIHDACEGPTVPVCASDVDCTDCAFCNGDETCVAGVCQADAPRDCDDSLECTTDSCDEVTDSCVHLPDDAVCDDGLFCNGEETCSVGSGCVSGSSPCPPGQFCREESDLCESIPSCPATHGCGPFGCLPTQDCTTQPTGLTECVEDGELRTCPGGIWETNCTCEGRRGAICINTDQEWECRP